MYPKDLRGVFTVKTLVGCPKKPMGIFSHDVRKASLMLAVFGGMYAYYWVGGGNSKNFYEFSPPNYLGKWSNWLHPGRLTWNLKMMVSKRKLLFWGLLFRFHVKFRGCMLQMGWLNPPTQLRMWKPWSCFRRIYRRNCSMSYACHTWSVPWNCQSCGTKTALDLWAIFFGLVARKLWCFWQHGRSERVGLLSDLKIIQPAYTWVRTWWV